MQLRQSRRNLVRLEPSEIPISAHFRRQTLLLLFLIGIFTSRAHALDPKRKLVQYGSQVWQTDSGLPQNTVRAILQTQDGYIWLATREGLARFDGIRFAVFNRRNSPQFLSNDIRSLLEDRQGNLWISTADGLVRRTGSNFVTYTTAQGLPDNNVWSVYQDNQKGLWVVTAGGIAHLDHNNFTPYTTRQGLVSNTVNAVVDGPDHSLWVATDTGLNQIRNGQVLQRRMAALLAGETIRAMASDQSGKLWLGTQNGLQSVLKEKVHTYNLANGLPGNEVDVLLVDRSGKIWAGTPDGLAVVDQGKLKTFTTKDGLPGSQIETLYQDREGTVWVGTNRGIARIENGGKGRISSFSAERGQVADSNVVLTIYEDREGSLWLGTESGGLEILRNQKFTTFTSQDGLSGDLVSSVLQDGNGNMWIGIDGSGLDRYDGKRISAFTTREGLTSNTVLSMAKDGEGGVWAGTPNGLNRLENGRFVSPSWADTLAGNFIRSLLVDQDGSLWVGTRHGLSHVTRSGTAGNVTTYTQHDGLASDFVGALAQSSDGSLWIGTLGGLSHFSHGKFENYTVRDGLSSNTITALYQDLKGDLWIGTNGEGLNLLRKNQVQHRIYSFAANRNLPDVIDGILEDNTGRLWISSNSGIFRMRISDLVSVAENKRHAFPMRSYGTADGMKISECSGIGHPSSWKASDGKLWFATLRGVARVNPAKLELNLVPPLVAIEQVSVDDEKIPLVRFSRIAPGRKRFAFRYAGLSFVAPQKVRFRYRLSGFDHSWVDAGTRRVAYYTNVPPGKYRFDVLASNNDGAWSKTPASIAFQLEPYFYQTYFFYLLCAILIAALAWLVYRWRVQQVEARFNAVLAERTRIAREIHDTLAQGFVGVSVQLELLTQLLSASPKAALDQLNQTRKLVGESLAEARRSIWNLRTNEAGAIDYASRFSSAIRERVIDTSVEINIQFMGMYRRLPDAMESELLKIALEAVANVVQHANATRLDIQMQYEMTRLRMRIVDNGAGFAAGAESSRPEGHFGLIGMRERAQSLQGSFALASRPGAGTRIEVEVPIQ